MLVPSRDDFYQFRHALLAEAVYDDLLPGERTACTRRTRGPCRTAAPAAPPRSSPATPASPRTTPPPSPRACVPVTTPAASAVPRRPPSTTSRPSSCGTTPGCPTTPTSTCPRLVGLVSDALITAGHPARALGVVREQLDHLPPDADDAVRGQLLGMLAGALVMTETQRGPARAARAEAVGAGRRQAVQRPGEGAGGPRPDAGRSGRYAEGREVAMTALALAERLDMPRLASDIRTTLVGLEQKGDSPESLVESLPLGDRPGRAAGASNAELRALLLLGNHHLDRGQFAEADAIFSARPRGPRPRARPGCRTPPRRAGSTASR